ncbi:MAG: hypothetical protein HZR80_10495 [Candidatus Heimdallarchaeota archaeon]
MPEKKDKLLKKINWFKYFLMKWRYRIDQSRALFALVTFAALLAVSYIEYITLFDKMGFWGVILFSLIIFVIFLILGYLYDVVMKMWKATIKVNVERNPYTYVPHPKEKILRMGLDIFLYHSLIQMSEKLGLKLTGEEKIPELINKYYSLSIANPNFEKDAKEVEKISETIRKIFYEAENKKE